MRGNFATYLGACVLVLPPAKTATWLLTTRDEPWSEPLLIIGGTFLTLAWFVARGSMLASALSIFCWLGFAVIAGPSHANEGPAWWWPAAAVGATILVFALLGAHDLTDAEYEAKQKAEC